MNPRRTWVNGVADGSFAVDDPGLWSGMGVFESLRTVDGAVFRLDAHLDRLAQSVAWMGWTWDRASVTRELNDLASEGGQLKLNVLITGLQRVVTAAPLDLTRVGAPVRCATVPLQAMPWLPGFVKHTSRAGWLLAVREASQRLHEPVDEVIWLDAIGCWTEANRSNLIAVREGAVYTPPLDGRILEGVTRAFVIDAARSAGIQVFESAVLADAGWSELYLCSTLKDLAPVVRLDGRAGPGGGPVGAELTRQMAKLRT